MFTIDPSKEYRCYVTDEIIPLERVEYLMSEGVPEHMLTSLNGSNAVYRPRKMLFVDDESNYVICDKIDETRIYAAERFGQDTEDKEEKEEPFEEKTFKTKKVTYEEEDEI